MTIPQVMLYPLIEASDVTWFREDMPGPPMATVGVMEVDFRRRTITLPEGKFDLDHFLRQVQNMLSHYDNPNREPKQL